ncbi:hypothetical protein M0657_007329 [Pyricularia oryzae]|nr:hypothetical protein M0657_007329 [Pyricularia oryzae]KAI7930600.1 hypothetical protein M9X92_000664 [Pyricularia oryzae]
MYKVAAVSKGESAKKHGRKMRIGRRVGQEQEKKEPQKSDENTKYGYISLISPTGSPQFSLRRNAKSQAVASPRTAQSIV